MPPPTPIPHFLQGDVTAEDAQKHPGALAHYPPGTPHTDSKVAMVEHRWTTDIIFLILLILCWTAMSAVGRLG